MNFPTIIFFSFFVLPLVAFLIWLMRQDKKKGITGIIIVILLVIGAIVWTYLKRDEAKEVHLEQSGSAVQHVETTAADSAKVDTTKK